MAIKTSRAHAKWRGRERGRELRTKSGGDLVGGLFRQERNPVQSAVQKSLKPRERTRVKVLLFRSPVLSLFLFFCLDCGPSRGLFSTAATAAAAGAAAKVGLVWEHTGPTRSFPEIRLTCTVHSLTSGLTANSFRYP